MGAPAELKAEVGGGRLVLGIEDEEMRGRAAGLLEGLPGVVGITGGDRLVVSVADAQRNLAPLLAALERAGIEPSSVQQSQVSLDDVFLACTGRQPRSEPPRRGATSGIFAVAHRRGRR